MHIDIQRFLRALLALVVLDSVAFSVVFVPRPPFTEEQWAFLEARRPKPSVSDVTMLFACADCLNFAVFRRGIGGWETFSANILQLVNLPAFLVAGEVFSARQARSSGSSKGNSDVATTVLVVAALVQCSVLALLWSIRFRRASSTA